MKIKIEIRTSEFRGEVALQEVKAALNNIGFEEDKEYSIQTYKGKPEVK